MSTPAEKLLNSACALAVAYGLRVFPVRVRDKRPATAHGFQDATTDPSKLSSWWSTAPYNIGIATGGGLVVLDVDTGNGKPGAETLAALERENGPLPTTWTATTGSGGKHFYFSCTDPALTVGVGFAPGLDYRGAGGYTVAPPSVHPSGGVYAWDPGRAPWECGLAALPDWLHGLMLERRKGKAPDPGPAEESAESWAERQRNAGMFRLACSLRSKGLSESALLAALLAENETRCVPPLTEKEIKTICGSVAKYRRGKATQQAADKVTAVSANDVPYAEPRWTLKPYIQRGKGTLIQGDPGAGKTVFACALAAHVSTGKALLDMPVQDSGPVLILSVEDDLSVLRGRLEQDGADLSKCIFLDGAAGLTLTSPEIEDAIRTHGAKLIIFDPLQAFLGAGVDMYRANETRPQLAALFEMCERNDCGCIILSHLGKSSADKSPVNRSLGSVDIPAAMRSVIQIIQDPTVKDQRIAVHVKSSNTSAGPSIVYQIVGRGGVEWRGYSRTTARDISRLERQMYTEKPGLDYEAEPLVKVFRQMKKDEPKRTAWTYDELAQKCLAVLGEVPYSGIGELRATINRLYQQLEERDGLSVTYGQFAGRNSSRGVKIVRAGNS